MKDETGGRIRSSSLSLPPTPQPPPTPLRIKLSLEEKHMSSLSEMDGDDLFRVVNIDDDTCLFICYVWY